MKYSEEVLQEALMHVAKIEGWHWETIEPQNRARSIEAILAKMMADLIVDGTIDTDKDSFIIATAYRDVLNGGKFRFMKTNED